MRASVGEVAPIAALVTAFCAVIFISVMAEQVGDSAVVRVWVIKKDGRWLVTKWDASVV